MAHPIIGAGFLLAEMAIYLSVAWRIAYRPVSEEYVAARNGFATFWGLQAISLIFAMLLTVAELTADLTTTFVWLFASLILGLGLSSTPGLMEYLGRLIANRGGWWKPTAFIVVPAWIWAVVSLWQASPLRVDSSRFILGIDAATIPVATGLILASSLLVPVVMLLVLVARAVGSSTKAAKRAVLGAVALMSWFVVKIGITSTAIFHLSIAPTIVLRVLALAAAISVALIFGRFGQRHARPASDAAN